MADDPTVPVPLARALQDRYELVRETGRGGSARVYLARDLKHDRFVAIKVLSTDLGPASAERFLREIRVLAGLQHPHILPMYDSGIADGHLYFVMPFVDGGSLRDRLETSRTLPLEEALRITRDIGVALAHAHGLGFVHRDVKPENILFYHGTACLADFGIARAMEGADPGITGQGMIIGTPAYMSPEQYAASGFDGRSDVYSLASVLHEMLAGARLFGGTTMQEVMAERGAMATKRTSLPNVPDHVAAIIDRGLAPNVGDRFPEANDFVAAIDDALMHPRDGARDSMPKRAITSVYRNRWMYGIGAAALVILVWPLGIDSDLKVGRKALASWDVPAAQKSLAAAVAADSSNADAQLWLTESYALTRGLNRDAFRVSALRLGKLRGRLQGRDSLLAEALIAAASDAPATACAHYGEMIRRDSSDARAWYGLGDCQLANSSVVRDSVSPSGWRFVTSYQAVGAAFMRALAIDPNAHAIIPFTLLSRVLPSDVGRVRIGFSAAPRDRFLAYPALIGDTLGFIPYPNAEIISVRPATISPTQPAALQRNRRLLIDVARQWSVASPNNANAWEALALAEERLGELSSDSTGAGGALRKARALGVTPLQQTRLAAAEVRLHIKRGEFERARALADSIVDARGPATEPATIRTIAAGLASLTGRLMLATRLSAPTTSDSGNTTGAPLAMLANQLFVRAASGVCDDTVRAQRQEFERVLVSYSAPNQRDSTRSDALYRVGAVSFPCLRGAGVAGIPATDPLGRAQRAFASGDGHRARLVLDSLVGLRLGYRPGDISLDYTVQEAWLRAATGDSAGAARQLDLVLDALPTLGAETVTDRSESASIGRAMVLRADLAAARHETAVARRWAAAAVDLWSGADASLAGTVARMKALSTK